VIGTVIAVGFKEI